MKFLLIVLVLLVAGVFGVGFYRGWFQFGSDNDTNKSNYTFSVDKNKIEKDEKTVAEDVKKLGHHATENATTTSENTTDGAVVKVSGDKLTMTDKEGKEHSHTLATNVKVTCDGKTCTAVDLKAGMKIRVTAESAAPHEATRIEALDKDAAFSTSHNGKAVSINGD
jgi:preprotein translocase subunit SecF